MPVVALDVKLQIFAHVLSFSDHRLIKVNFETTTASTRDSSPTTEIYCRYDVLPDFLESKVILLFN